MKKPFRLVNGVEVELTDIEIAQIEAESRENESRRAITQSLAAVQAHLDGIARAAGYDNIFTAVTYADEAAVPKYQNEGRALRAWRSATWERCSQLLAEVELGTRVIPSNEELIDLLPPAPDLSK